MADTQHPMERALELVQLAGVYVDDGAFFTAAKRLHEAADLVEQHAKECRDAEQLMEKTNAS